MLINPLPSFPLVYIHISKAAGNTLASIVLRQYRHVRIVHFSGYNYRSYYEFCQSFCGTFRHNKEHIRVLTGYIPFGSLDAYLPCKAKYFTFVRDPVKRIISLYYHILGHPKDELHNYVTKKSMTLDEFVGSDISDELDNYQTRYISGLTDTPIVKCSSEMLDQAKRNLENEFVFPGTVEKFDESLILLKRCLHWSMPLYTKLNVANNRPIRSEIGVKTLSEILKRNSLDVALYDFVNKRLQKAITNQDTSFRREVALFRYLNYLYNRSSVVKKVYGKIVAAKGWVEKNAEEQYLVSYEW